MSRAPHPPEPGSRTAIAVRDLSKAFGPMQALRDFQIDLREGEVHALVGGNGSGKSTFIKILAGVYHADRGELVVRGRESRLIGRTPGDAKADGFRFVHQDLGLVPILDVAENLALGRGYPTDGTGRIRWRSCHAQARDMLARFHVDIDPATPVANLSLPQCAMVAIVRALQSVREEERAILILDEPTAALPAEEATLLLSSIRRLAEQGHTVMLVTHRLEEVRRAADRVTGVRDGGWAGTVDADTMGESDLVQLILGRRLEAAHASAATVASAEPVIEAQRITSGPLKDLDLAVRPGEVVGIAGLLGSGRTELLETLFGLRSLEDGRVRLEGRDVTGLRPSRARRLGIAFVPEDRRAAAVFPDQDIADNMTAGRVAGYFRRGLMRDRALRRDVRTDIGRFRVKAGSEVDRIETLSGGNQQKVVLARWLRTRPKVLLLDEPTQGIDVGAREDIFTLINEVAAAGTAVILVSSEFEELTRLSHRICVLAEGRIVREFGRGVSSHDVLQSVLQEARSLLV